MYIQPALTIEPSCSFYRCSLSSWLHSANVSSSGIQRPIAIWTGERNFTEMLCYSHLCLESTPWPYVFLRKLIVYQSEGKAIPYFCWNPLLMRRMAHRFASRMAPSSEKQGQIARNRRSGPSKWDAIKDARRRTFRSGFWHETTGEVPIRNLTVYDKRNGNVSKNR